MDKKNLFYKGVKCFNELSNEIKTCVYIAVFKTRLYEYCKTLVITENVLYIIEKVHGVPIVKVLRFIRGFRH